MAWHVLFGLCSSQKNDGNGGSQILSARYTNTDDAERTLALEIKKKMHKTVLEERKVKLHGISDTLNI